MKLFNNKEVRRMFIFLYIITLVLAVVILFVGRWFACLILLLSGVIYSVIYYISTKKRYKKISELSTNIDKLLHGDSSIDFNSYDSGELSILENELSKMTIRLKNQADSLGEDKAFLSDSIADLSHQIRTPLTSINLILIMLRKRDISEDKRMQLINDLSKLVSQIDWQINALLKLSKLDAGTITLKKDYVNVDDLIKECMEQFSILLDIRSIETAFNISKDASFTGDKEWTKEALNNIIKNCIEHTQDGGKLEISSMENSIYTEISIKDNGSGIASEDMPHIFERFYKGKNADANSIGIGLSLSKTILINQNATIKAENIKPTGTRFIIRFYKSTV